MERDSSIDIDATANRILTALNSKAKKPVEHKELAAELAKVAESADTTNGGKLKNAALKLMANDLVLKIGQLGASDNPAPLVAQFRQDIGPMKLSTPEAGRMSLQKAIAAQIRAGINEHGMGNRYEVVVVNSKRNPKVEVRRINPAQ